jgi:hypothetical protein
VRAPFVADERGLVIVRDAGAIVADHAPTLVGRFDESGHDVSVETLLPGTELGALLARPRATALLPRVESVAQWICDVGAATARPADALHHERSRLRRLLPDVPTTHGIAAVVDDVREVPAVVRHGDLGTWNVLLTADSFSVVDWETATPAGFPLWDLLNFLQDALASIDIQRRGGTREEHFVRLFRGELPSSRLLFDMVRAGVNAVGLDPAVVGPITTLLFADQAATVAAAVRSGEPTDPAGWSSLHIRRYELWMSDPALGPQWRAWER